MKPLKICKLHPRIFTPEMPARPAVTEIYGKYLPKMGHEVTWLCPSEENKIQKREYKNLDIITIPRATSGGLLNKAWDIIQYYKTLRKKFKTIDRKKRFDIVQVRNSIDYSILLMNSIRDETSFVYQYSFPKSRYRYEENPLRYLMGFRDSILVYPILEKSDFVFPISKWMKNELVQKGISKSKMMPVPMGVNPNSFSPKLTGKKIIEKYSIYSKNILIYVGGMQTNYRFKPLKKLIYAFRQVLADNPDTILLMVGSKNEKLIELSHKLGVDENIIFTGKVPYAKVPDYLSASDINLSIMPDIPLFETSSPTKLVEGMAAGKPVVANREVPDHVDVINKSEGGVLVDLEPGSISEGITHLLENPNLRKEMGKKGRKWVVENRSYGKIAKKIEKVYYDLIDE